MGSQGRPNSSAEFDSTDNLCYSSAEAATSTPPDSSAEVSCQAPAQGSGQAPATTIFDSQGRPQNNPEFDSSNNLCYSNAAAATSTPPDSSAEVSCPAPAAPAGGQQQGSNPAPPG